MFLEFSLGIMNMIQDEERKYTEENKQKQKTRKQREFAALIIYITQSFIQHRFFSQDIISFFYLSGICYSEYIHSHVIFYAYFCFLSLLDYVLGDSPAVLSFYCSHCIFPLLFTSGFLFLSLLMINPFYQHGGY